MCAIVPLLVGLRLVAAPVLPAGPAGVDSAMDRDPGLPPPPVVYRLPAGLPGLWVEALGRPEADLKCQAARAIATAHERGMAGMGVTAGALARPSSTGRTNTRPSGWPPRGRWSSWTRGGGGRPDPGGRGRPRPGRGGRPGPGPVGLPAGPGRVARAPRPTRRRAAGRSWPSGPSAPSGRSRRPPACASWPSAGTCRRRPAWRRPGRSGPSGRPGPRGTPAGSPPTPPRAA